MTTYAEAVKAMKAFFYTQWDNATPIIWGSDDVTTPPNDEPWIRFNINHSAGGQASIGSPTANRFRHIGFLTIQVFAPEGNYGILAKDLANAILELYQGTSDSDIDYYNVRVDEVGNDGYGWFQINIIADFRYDNIT
jgi:hypothetical protein